MNETTFLLIVGAIAVLIVLGTLVTALIVLRKPSNKAEEVHATNDVPPVSVQDRLSGQQPTQQVPTPIEDIEAYLAEQRGKLAEFELHDLSNTFKGTTNAGQRKGIILHHSAEDTPLIAFSSQGFNAQTGTINAETSYGKMEIVITQGHAGVQWDGKPIGVLDYPRQRILSDQGQLLGDMNRPEVTTGEPYAIGFFGETAAMITTNINALSTLRWFGGDGDEISPAFTGLKKDLDDTQTLLLMGALLLEIGFFDIL